MDDNNELKDEIGTAVVEWNGKRFELADIEVWTDGFGTYQAGHLELSGHVTGMEYLDE